MQLANAFGSLVVQTLSQLPQLAASVAVSTQPAAHWVSPGLQVAVHEPATHASLWLGSAVAQLFEQAPQLPRSVSRLAQLAPQSASPASLQVAILGGHPRHAIPKGHIRPAIKSSLPTIDRAGARFTAQPATSAARCWERTQSDDVRAPIAHALRSIPNRSHHSNPIRWHGWRIDSRR